MKKRLTFFALATILATPVLADWVKTGRGADFHNYIDPATVRRTGSTVRVWSLSDYESVRDDRDGTGPYRSVKVLREYDCRNETTRSIYIASYRDNMGEGAVTYSNSSSTPATPIIPESIGATVWGLLCAK